MAGWRTRLHPGPLSLRFPDDVESRWQYPVKLGSAPAAVLVEIVIVMINMATWTLDLGAEEAQRSSLRPEPLGPSVSRFEGLSKTDPAFPSLDPSGRCAGAGDDPVVRERRGARGARHRCPAHVPSGHRTCLRDEARLEESPDALVYTEGCVTYERQYEVCVCACMCAYMPYGQRPAEVSSRNSSLRLKEGQAVRKLAVVTRQSTQRWKGFIEMFRNYGRNVVASEGCTEDRCLGGLSGRGDMATMGK